MGDLTSRVINQLRRNAPPEAARIAYEKTPLTRAPQPARLDQAYNGYELEPLGGDLVDIITVCSEFTWHTDILGNKSKSNQEVNYKIKKMLKFIPNTVVFTNLVIVPIFVVLSAFGCLPAQARNRSSSH